MGCCGSSNKSHVTKSKSEGKLRLIDFLKSRFLRGKVSLERNKKIKTELSKSK